MSIGMKPQSAPAQIEIENRRRGVGRFVRVIYALGIIGLGLYFGTSLLMSFAFLEGPGIVTAKRHQIAVPYVAHIQHVNVIIGIPVLAGDEIATIYAPDINREISGLIGARTELAIREADINIKVSIAESSLGPASERLHAARDAEKRLNEASGQAYSLGYRAEVMRESVEAVRLNAELSAGLTEAKRQLAILAERRADIDAQIARIQSSYNDGAVVTTEDGVVSTRLAAVGSIILPGEPIAEILDQDTKIIEWYLPSLQFREPRRGDRVYVTSGKNIVTGTVDEVLPITGATPNPNAPILRTPDQGQMARVKIDAHAIDLPFDSRVMVHMNYFYFVDDLIRKIRS